jgi:NADP-dependent 3-hydroxy acid dehydrogenase YdfG
MKLERSHTQALALAGAVAGAYLAMRVAKASRYNFGAKVVLITGGSRGLGLVLARQLAGDGARLALLARGEQELQQAERDIRERVPDIDLITVAADVCKRYEIERAVALVIERFGRVDVVINNAGTIQVGPMDHMALSDYEDAMSTHFWGPLYLSLAVIPSMRRQGGGRIVNISSIGGRLAVPHMVPYSASKFALSGLSDGLRAELARQHRRHERVSRADAYGLARERAVQGPGIRGIHLVRDRRLPPGADHQRGARRRPDSRGVPARRCGTRHHGAGKARNSREDRGARAFCAGDVSGQLDAARSDGSRWQSHGEGQDRRIGMGVVEDPDAHVCGGPAEQRAIKALRELPELARLPAIIRAAARIARGSRVVTNEETP